MSQTLSEKSVTTAAPLLLRERRGAVAILKLNRPEARNALSEGLIGALQQALVTLNARSDVHVIVIAGQGPAFCAGHDLRELTAHRDDGDGGRSFYSRIMSQCSQLMQAIVKSPKPVIAAVEGIATAAGCQLVASCDLAVAGASARFATPGVNIGLFCSTPMVALSRNVSRKRAMEMLLLGEWLGAEEAAEWGLLNRTVADGQALAAAVELGAKIAAKSPLTVAIGKEAFHAQLETSLEHAYSYAAEVMVQNMMTHDAQEGIGAFLEKRSPEWKGC